MEIISRKWICVAINMTKRNELMGRFIIDGRWKMIGCGTGKSLLMDMWSALKSFGLSPTKHGSGL